MSFKAGWFILILAGVAGMPGILDVAHAQVEKVWVATYDGPGRGLDWPCALAIDRDGNVLVTGSSGPSGPSGICTTLKYSPDGKMLWLAQHGGVFDTVSPTAMAVDAGGNVCVTGASEGDYFTVKYSSDGKELWVQKYAGEEGLADSPAAIGMDADGNVIVTGAVGVKPPDPSMSGFATIKYSPDGTELWVRRFDGLGELGDRVAGLAIDADGNVLVAGEAQSAPDLGHDYATVKYAPDGTELWIRLYDGPEALDDSPAAIAIGADGSVLVTGTSTNADDPEDYATIKYSSDGKELWVRRYDGPANLDDTATGLAVDAEGNVLVTGESDGGPDARLDCATVKYAPDGTELWARRWGGAGTDRPRGVAVDAGGNAYVAGESAGSGGTGSDYAIVKYAPDGKELWVQTWNGPASGNDRLADLALDGAGSLVVTGYAANLGGNGDYATLKLDPGGNLIWLRMYNTGAWSKDEEATALSLDAAGGVLVTGRSLDPGTGFDFATVKYGEDGTRLWVERYNGPGDGDDKPAGMAVDAAGNVLVAGESAGSAETGLDYATVKYDAGGQKLWVRRWSGPGSGDDRARGVALDATGNVHVTGESSGSPETSLDYATVKYAPDGQELWARRWGAAGDDKACGVVVDAAGSVLVAGESAVSAGTGPDYATVKYAPGGQEVWVRRYEGPGGGDDRARAMAIDGKGNVHVTGESFGGIRERLDYATVKYAPDGSELWVRRYNGPGSKDDRPCGIAVDAAGNVHVTGESPGLLATGLDCATVKYDPDGNELWAERYAVDDPTKDLAKAIALDGAGNVLVAVEQTAEDGYGFHSILKYAPGGRLLCATSQAASIAAISADDRGGIYVTGWGEKISMAPGQEGKDYTTIKYETLRFQRGDADADGKTGITDAIVVLEHLFLGGAEPPCLDAADVDDSGELNLTDAVRLLSHLFLGGLAPQEPFPGCGRDVTLDSIECNAFEPCLPDLETTVFSFGGQQFEAEGVFFVVDNSWSMSDAGEIGIAKREIALSINELPTGMQFGIVFFDVLVSKFPESGVPASANLDAKENATRYLQSVQSGTGSCPQQGLKAGLRFAHQSKSKKKVLIYVGDGGGTCQGADEATYLRQTVDAITATNIEGVPIHCFGVLNPTALGVDFMRRLADANGGTYARILR